MPERTESQIEIASDAATVMSVIADITAYPQWCPGVNSAWVEEYYPDSRPRDVAMTFDSGPIQDTHHYRYDSWSQREVRWHLTSGQTVTGLWGRYTCRGVSPHVTVVNYRLAMELSVPIIGALKRRAEKVIVRTALKGLRERVESRP